MMEDNRFFNEADFDITANIESALADISFSAIELPPDLNQSHFDASKSKEYSFASDFVFFHLCRKQSFYNKSFASSILDKAVMDNLDLTFTESLAPSKNPGTSFTTNQKGGANVSFSSSSWRPSKKSSNITLLNDDLDKEISKALKSIPENLELSLTSRPTGILKPAKQLTRTQPQNGNFAYALSYAY